MPQPSAERILDHVWRTFGAASLAGVSDGDLLRRAAVGRDREAQTAFEVLLQRHGPLVYRTCYAMLKNVHDAEDAFQATFLVLTRKAAGLHASACVGPWLFEVARRIALHANAAAERRRKHERQAATTEMESVEPDLREELSQLHDALGRLPTRLRLPIVLCDLEGLSYQQAADKLGWTVAAFRNRLARGRQKLQSSMRRLGHDPAAAIAAYGAIPAVPHALLQTTATNAVQTLFGAAAAGAIPASILALTNSGIQTMLLIKLKTAGLALVATSVLIAGAVGLSGQSPRAKSDDQTKATPSAPDKPEPNVSVSSKTAALVAKLTGPASIEKQIVDAPLRDVLEFLSEKYDVTFLVNPHSFELVGKRGVEDEKVRLARMPNVTLDTILRHVMTQVNGAVMVRNDHLEIVSRDSAVLESRNGALVSFNSDMQPLVNVAADDRPLALVSADLSRQSGRNVVLDSRIPDRGRLTVSVTLLNTPLDTATRIVAELVNLKTVAMDNVIFVTSPDNAAMMIAENDAARERRQAALREYAKPEKGDAQKL